LSPAHVQQESSKSPSEASTVQVSGSGFGSGFGSSFKNVPKTENFEGASASDAKELNRQTWQAYEKAYESRYGEAPVRNAAANAKIA